MRCRVVRSLGLALLAVCGGCHSCDRVESELRARENDVLQLRDELDRTCVVNQALQQEVRALRGELGVPPDGPPPAAYPVQSLVLGRQTGGRCNNDTCPGDDSLQVQVEPRDADGQAIKAPGALVVQVQEITPEGTKRPLSAWEVPPDRLRRTWKNGLLTTGYVVNLPWKVWPSTEKLRVTAQFQLPDGRLFEADRDVSVRVIPANKRPPAAVPPAPSGSPPTVLPPPRQVEPAKPGKPADAVPGPFLGIEPDAPPSAAILQPVPLNK